VLRTGEVEAVKVHYLVPGRYKVVHELLGRVLTRVDFRQGPELGVASVVTSSVTDRHGTFNLWLRKFSSLLPGGS
jgi:hypothetical protein